MEFACSFVYVPPSVSVREVQRPAAKRSALLPPVKLLRPRTPPPPPPVQPADPKLKALQPPAASQRSPEAAVSRPVSLFLNRPEFRRRPEAAASPSPTGAGSPGAAASRRIALLPSLVRPGKPYASFDSTNQRLRYDEAESEPGSLDELYSNTLPNGSGSEGEAKPSPGSPPPLPPRPPLMPPTPEYVMVLPSPASTPATTPPTPPRGEPPPPVAKEKEPLPGNPNIVLVSLGKLLSEETEPPAPGEPTPCSRCGSVLEPRHEQQVKACYFCQSGDWTRLSAVPQRPVNGQNDELFLLNADEPPPSAAGPLLLFCIDASGSMNISSDVSELGDNVHRTRLEFVQEAVLQCVQELSDRQPEIRVGLITFNYQVTMHGCSSFQSRLLSGAELNDSGLLREAAAEFPVPPPLSQTKDCLRKQILGLSANGETALGPAALLAVATASRLPGSKVIICTDGKANAKLGNLEEDDAQSLLSSTIFYQDLGEYAASQGVTVSVLSIEGTDCRLDELGRLADRTGGKVVIARPDQLHSEFEEIIRNRAVATHCAVTLLLPKSLRLIGEREAGHRGTREVGNVNTDTEVTIQFGAGKDTEVAAPSPGSRVVLQLQIRYRRNGQSLLRVFTAEREVTDDSSAALSSLSLFVVQLNSLQASAALAVRGRFLEARAEGALQQRLVVRAIEHNQSAEDEATYQEWVKTMEPISTQLYTLTRRSAGIPDRESLTDAGAALLFTLKHSNRNSVLLRDKQQL